ncbi:hypothetical protein HMPREF1869_00719 [Bacteroidales bacterium KA00251]|nr:hypothetical protein HMPREF1869_00719 [Bacteroidales bacterium KA00251]
MLLFSFLLKTASSIREQKMRNYKKKAELCLTARRGEKRSEARLHPSYFETFILLYTVRI